MPVAQTPTVITAEREEEPEHPKYQLYANAYDPITRAWFESLAASADLKRLLAEIPGHDLVTNLLRFNDLFYQLVDVTMAALPNPHNEVLSVVSKHRQHVLWEGHMAPGEEAEMHEIELSLSEKIKRNISLGVIEALICLESACAFAYAELGLRGEDLAGTLQRSRQLYGSLAALHDEQEKVRLGFLAGIDGPLSYPEIDYQQVIDGTIAISTDKFVVVDADGSPRLRFVLPPVPGVAALTSPIRRCPAHRFRSPENPGLTLTDVLWDLLVDIYRRAGRFA